MDKKYVLEANNITAGYAADIVLNDVSFSVRPGEMVGIIGPNGAGKSTLLKTLRGFLPLRAGNIALHGQNISSVSTQQWALFAAFLQQHGSIMAGYTVRDVAAAGRYPHLRWWQHESEKDAAIIDAGLAFTGIRDLADRDMETLSGGQQQRAFLAKVLIQQTELLLLDEPAAGLDVFYKEEIFSLCQTLCRAGKTILIVAHELPLAARYCSRLLLLGKGKLLVDGPADEVLTDAWLSRAYGVPIHVDKNPVTGHPDVYGTGTSIKETRDLDILMGSKWGGAFHEE